MDGEVVRAMYLGGGKSLKSGAASIERSEPGLAYVEKTANGYVLSNPSPTAGIVTVTLPGLAGLKAFKLDDQGRRTGEATVTAGPLAGSIVVQFEPASKLQFAEK